MKKQATRCTIYGGKPPRSNDVIAKDIANKILEHCVFDDGGFAIEMATEIIKAALENLP